MHVAILYEVHVGLQAFYLYDLAADLGMLAFKVSKQFGSEQCTADYLQSLPAFPALNKSLFCGMQMPVMTSWHRLHKKMHGIQCKNSSAHYTGKQSWVKLFTAARWPLLRLHVM